MRLRWQNEKAVIDRIRAVKAQIEEKKSEEIKAEKVGDLNRSLRSVMAPWLALIKN